MRVVLLPFALILPFALSAQTAGAGRPGPRPLLPAAEEIGLARSAAPASISRAARVWLLTDQGWVVGDSGSSNVSCLVNRSWPASLEPECFDAEAAATVMPMEMRRTELLHRGTPTDEVEREIARGLMDGRYRLPARMAVVYMMSARQQLIGDDGKPAGAWRPHLMIHFPFLTNEQVGHHGDAGLEAGMVVDPGKPTANLMVVVPAFAKPAVTPSP
jgi:hypothetical protein